VQILTITTCTVHSAAVGDLFLLTSIFLFILYYISTVNTQHMKNQMFH